MNKNRILATLAVLFVIVFSFAGCMDWSVFLESWESSQSSLDESGSVTETTENSFVSETSVTTERTTATPQTRPVSVEGFSLDDVPKWSGKPYVEVHGNQPYFSKEEMTTESFEYYSLLDSLERCGYAYACLGRDLMPNEPRGNIGMIKPSGWHTVKYEFIDGKYLYNRCHLIAFALAGENANRQNLITGTRTMNTKGMLPFEDMVRDYIMETDNHVLYRVTPIFESDNLLASGVLMEGYSVEDEGDGVCFAVYCYNEEPQVQIDHLTGDSVLSTTTTKAVKTTKKTTAQSKAITTKKTTNAVVRNGGGDVGDITYVLNKNSKKFHKPNCSSVKQMSSKNRWDVDWTREEVLDKGYIPCKNCNP